jgi:hypothetical protein
MKFVKTLLAIAAVVAVLPAQAESNIASGAGALSATAKLNFRVTIPRVLYLRVGTGTDFAPSAVVDRVLFSPAAGNIGTGTAVAGTFEAPAASPLTVRLLSTGGAPNLSAAGSGTGLTGVGLQTIPWTQITGGTTNAALPNPVIGAAAVPVAAVNGVASYTANWNFNYSNSTELAAGEYNGVVTYTAALP